mmetsp:Transcript_6634/g.11068  ORF Transcript_6634/g.11068 Transcript_6634/m.11068 type:complete len:83 (+) Transcript_6634:60-308(+)
MRRKSMLYLKVEPRHSLHRRYFHVMDVHAAWPHFTPATPHFMTKLVVVPVKLDRAASEKNNDGIDRTANESKQDTRHDHAND